MPGLGFIASEQVRELIGAVGVKISRMLIDPVTGATVETATASYRPSAAIARHVRLRDGTCRFPSCSRRAERAELDHVIPWPAGPTKVGNLICLCKHHHRLKHASAWRPELLADGVVLWTDPYGDRYATYPVDHRDLTTHASWQGRRPA